MIEQFLEIKERMPGFVLISRADNRPIVR